MFKMTDEYLDELDRKVETGDVTDQDEEEFMENITDVYIKMKKIAYFLLYGGLVSIIVGVSSLFAYFYLHDSIYDTGEVDIIYFLYLGIGFLGLGGFFAYYSLNKMPLLTEINDEFEIEEDEE